MEEKTKNAYLKKPLTLIVILMKDTGVSGVKIFAKEIHRNIDNHCVLMVIDSKASIAENKGIPQIP